MANPPLQPAPPPRFLWPALALPVLFLIFAVPLIRSGNLSGRGAYDQLLFHEPTIRQFAREWPRFDLHNYLSATTPGYHILLAAYARFVDPSRQALQLVGSIFTVGLLSTLAAACARRSLARSSLAGHAERAHHARLAQTSAGPEAAAPHPASTHGARRPMAIALICCLPALASMYIFFPGVWLLPDNIAWWGVLAVLLIALHEPWTRWSPILAGLVLLGLVFCRQAHLWVAAPIWIAAWTSIAPRADNYMPGPLDDFAALFRNLPRRFARLLPTVIATIPAILLVAAFYKLWGGLVVPRYQDMYGGRSPAAPAFILATLAIISGFYGGFILPPLLSLWRNSRGILGFAAFLGLIAAVVPVTTYSLEEGRFSGLWRIVEKVPVIAGHTSPVMLILAPLGAVALAGWLVNLSHSQRWISIAALVGFGTAQYASPQLWQRYNDPLLLMLVALWACSSSYTRFQPVPDQSRSFLSTTTFIKILQPLRVLGPVGLALLLAAITYRSISTAQPVKPEESPQYVAPAS